LGDAQCSRAEVGAKPCRLGQLGEKRQENAARARAKIEHAQWSIAPTPLLDEIERSRDQGLGIGPWIEHVGIDEKAPSVELSGPGNARDRLAPRAASDQLIEPQNCLRKKCLTRPRDKTLMRQFCRMTE
jgi:hypothetical protein